MARHVKQGFPLNISDNKVLGRQTTNRNGRSNKAEKQDESRRGYKKQLHSVSKALPPLDDPDLPPPPRYLPARQGVNVIVVTWEMQTSSDHLGGAIDAIGAHCRIEKVDDDIMFVSRIVTHKLPANSPAGDQLTWQDGYEHWVQDEKQCVASFVKWLAKISGRKYDSKDKRDATSDVDHAKGIVLLSFAGIAARIPNLMLALRRHKLLTSFQNVVAGVCDLNAMALGTEPSASIGTLSRFLLGVNMPETDDLAVQSRHLYKIISQVQQTETKTISSSLHPLTRNTFLPEYIMKLSAWRFKTDHRAIDLRAIVTTKVGKGVKRKRSLIKNLLAVGYDYGSLRKQYQALGEFIFREVLLNKLRHMKQYRESNLTDTKEVGCKTVIESVVNHFKEIEKERSLKRAPPLD